MAPPLSRRSLLQAAALAAAAPAINCPATGRAAAVVQGAQAVSVNPSAWGVQPFALDDVALRPGLFADKRQLMLDHARGYDVDRLLQVFRANAGLATGGAVAPGGWEGLDGEANGNLRGHYTGHFLTMLAQAYAGTGEQVFVDRIRTMVGALTEARAALRKDPAVLSVDGRFGTAAENVRGAPEVGPYRNAALSGDLMPSLIPVSGNPLHHILGGTEFAPFFEGTEDPTHAYFRRSEPRVILGNTDSGVANPAKADGTTLLDEIWAGAPFAGKGALVARVRSTVDA